jgi:hypothetical protein
MKVYHNCQHVRVVLVKSYVYDYNTGEKRDRGAQWRVQKCGAPMFTENERIRGTCRHCDAGWEHPENFTAPLGAAEGVIDAHTAAKLAEESGTERLFKMPEESASEANRPLTLAEAKKMFEAMDYARETKR